MNMNYIIHIIRHTARTATVLLLALLAAQTAGATDLTDFVAVSSQGTATARFAFSDHFYRVDWTGINTSQTTSVQLIYNPTSGYLIAKTNGDTSGGINLATNADFSAHWMASDITGLTPGQSSDGYTSYDKLSANAGTKSAKVCTVTCVAALKPKWNWSSDHSTCTATFMCAENTSLTATVNATVTSSSEPYAANVTFNGTSYSYVAPVTYSITYVLNGGTNAASNPNTYRDDETVTLSDPMRTGYVFEGWYDNSGFSGTAVTGIPYDSSGDKTFYAKWKAEIDGLTYDATIGGFIIDSPEALNTLATYSKSNNCSGKTFKQTADIALSGNFTGIGCYDHPFSGTYDGGNHYITGLYEKKYVNYLGLFLMTNGATINNVRLVSPYIDSSNTAGTSFSDGIGGLIGSSNNTTVSDCYVLDPTVIGNSGWSGAIVGWGSVSGNYYYTENDALPAVGNGSSTAIRLRKLTLPGSVTGGSVTASSGVQLNYNSTLYCAENASVTLTITPEKGYILSALTVNGTDVTGSVSNNSYTFNMPTEDITMTAAFVKETFTYVDMNGVTQTVEAERITSDSRVGLYSGWYAVGGNVTRNSGFNLTSGGDGVVINIILCDGATLNLPNSTINTAGGGKPNLVIWGQENGTGTLSCLSIINQVTSVTVNGGKLYCSVSNYNCAINGDLIVNGGEVHLAAGSNTCVNGSVTYNGGILDTKKISGSTTLNWSNATTDRVKASEYGGSVTIADGKFFKDASGNYYYGSLTDAQKNAIKNVELQPSPNAHFITVDAAVHGAATAPAVAESGNTVTVTVAPDTGYKVASVKYNNTDATKADDTHFTFTMPTSNVTVTASFQPITYTITYNNLEGATFAASNPVSYTVESEAITLNNPIKTGYTFGGWTGTDLDGITQTVTIPSGSTGDRAYTANWTTHTYSVQFNGNGATDGEMSAQSFTYDEPKELTANAYTRTGYTFTGWNTAADGTGMAYTDGQAVQNLTAENGAAVTLYAQWTANTYTIHFVAGIPVNGEMPDQSLTYGQAANLTANTFSTTKGYFVNWNTEADGSGTTYTDGQEVLNLTAEDGAVITLYAQWRLQHRFNYNNTIFRCYNVDTPNQVYWAYAGETVKVEVIDGTSEYTIRVVNGDGEDITLDTGTNTFVMPDEEVWITYTSVKKMAYTSIYLDNFESWEDVVYLYDADHPTVTPTVTVKDGETVLTEGTDYTLAITNNTGSATQMVTATVTVTGMGGYVGTNTVEFRISPFNIANCKIKGTLEAYDDGYGPYNQLSANVEVWNGETQLTLDTDYTIELDPRVGTYDYVVGEQYQATIKGTGDWGGTKTFTFTFVALHHTVVFDANGGSGTMGGGTVANDGDNAGRYYLPECTFTAPDGKVFSHWVVYYKGIEEDPIKQPGDYFTAPYINSVNNVQTITVTAYWRDALILLDDDSAQPEGSKNADIIAANNETTGLTVQLAGRTLYKDGSWNTLCLPFSVTTASGTLSGDGVKAMTLNTETSNLTDGTLTLNFTAATTIPAGTPFIIKWDNTGVNIENPVFEGVTVSNATNNATIEGVLTFTGTYAPVSIGSEGDKTKLYLGSSNKLYYPNGEMTIGTHRAYFQLAPGITAGNSAGGNEHGDDVEDPVRAFNLNFGDDETTGIISVHDSGFMVNGSDAWYTIDGRKLDGKPTQRGIYINNGKKIAIK